MSSSVPSVVAAAAASAAARGVALVMGVGPGVGAAVIRQFRSAGFIAVGLSRSATSKYKAAFTDDKDIHLFDCDAGSEASVAGVVETVESTLGPIEFLCFNVGGSGGFKRTTFLETRRGRLPEQL